AVGLAVSAPRVSSRVLAWGCCAVLVFTILDTGSRAAFVGIAVLMLLYILLVPTSRVVSRTIIVATALVVVSVTGVIDLGTSNAVDRLLGNDPNTAQSDEQRAEFRDDALTQIRAHPITGVGFEVAQTGHNIYLQVVAAAGVLGALGMLGLGL